MIEQITTWIFGTAVTIYIALAMAEFIATKAIEAYRRIVAQIHGHASDEDPQ